MQKVTVTNASVLLSAEPVDEGYYNLSQTSSGFSSLGPGDIPQPPTSLVSAQKSRKAARSLSQVVFRTKCAEHTAPKLQLERKESSIYVAANRLVLRGQEDDRSQSPDSSSGSATLPAATAYSDVSSSSSTYYATRRGRTVVSIGEPAKSHSELTERNYETEEVSLWLEEDGDEACSDEDVVDAGVVVWRCSGTGPKRRTWILRRRRRRSRSEGSVSRSGGRRRSLCHESSSLLLLRVWALPAGLPTCAKRRRPRGCSTPS